MPAVPSCLIDPLFAELDALLGAQLEFSATHPWGCHRRRISHRVVFEHIVAAMVHGSGYEIVASVGCSDRTIRRRLKEWATKGLGQKLHQLALAAYERSSGWSWATWPPTAVSRKHPVAATKPAPHRWIAAKAA